MESPDPEERPREAICAELGRELIGRRFWLAAKKDECR